MSQAVEANASQSTQAKPKPNPWLVLLAFFGAATFLVGLLFVVLGVDHVCYGDYCAGIWGKVNVPVLLGVVLLSTSLVIWAIAMAAAAVCWPGQKTS